MTDTPRTDNEAFSLPVPTGEISQGYVRADFARQLERENAELADALEGMMSAFDFLPCDPSEFCPDAWSAAKSAIAKAKGVQP